VKWIHVSRTLPSSLSAAEIWPAVADTELQNRAARHVPLSVALAPPEADSPYRLRTRLGGFEVEYEQPPFEWVENERWSVVRRFLRGPIRELRMTAEVRPREAGSEVEIRLSMLPRWPFIRLPMWRAMKQSVRRISGAIAHFAQTRRLETAEPAEKVDHGALLLARAALAARCDPALATQLAEWVERAPQSELGRMRPFALAQAWGRERTEVLSACLEAVPAGLLALHWDLVCPSCRTAPTSVETLSQLSEAGHCPLCDLSFPLELDRSVEAVFTPHPAIRQTSRAPFCIAGPGRSPHVISQALLPANGQAGLPVPREPGRYRLFVKGGLVATVEPVLGAPERQRVRVERTLPAELKLAPGGVIELENASDQPRHAKLERLAWAEQAATAQRVMMLPRFRDRFSTEVLRPGLALKVKKVALLFTDLTGSTALYTALGEAAAFRVVLDHFEVLREAIARHGGAEVKTIGDAVMAAFGEEKAAIEASIAMLGAFEAYRAAKPERASLRLKVGVHAVASFVVTSNNQLDYFGQTVNMAARLQGVAAGGELVLDEESGERAQAAGWLGADVELERAEVELKGVGRRACVRVRLRPSASKVA
jgi:adenylate cyclase